MKRLLRWKTFVDWRWENHQQHCANDFMRNEFECMNYSRVLSSLLLCNCKVRMCLPLCLLYFCPQGAVPATIGILKGQIHVGLTNDQLEELAAKKVPCIKTSRRDFPYVLSQVCWTLLFPLPSCIVTNSLPYLNAILLRLGKPDRNWMEALQSLVPWLLQPKLAFQYLSQVSPSSLNLFARGNEGVTRVLLIKSFVLWNVISLS